MAVIGLSRPRPVGPSVGAVRDWLAARWEVAWVVPLIAIAGIAHAWNMFDFPYYENDEGTYVSQAWAVFHNAELAPYTYYYDHPPLGWIQLGLLSTLIGGFNALGNTVATGRLFMFLYQVGSAALVYVIARGSGRTVFAASVAVLTFSLSAYGLYLHRRVLLDNIATFWLLLALTLLIGRRPTLTRIWLSALSLGAAILSKEIIVVVVPAMTILVARQVDRSHRLVAIVGWLALVGGVASTWILLAVLKGELFPMGTFLGGSGEHVSLIGTLLAQAARDKDGGLLEAHSAFWRTAQTWVLQDPTLVVLGSTGAALSVLRLRRHVPAGVIGLSVLCLWLFLGRGGVTLGFYLVPLLPLLALSVAWLIDATRAAITAATRVALGQSVRPIGVSVFLLSVVIVGTASGYRDALLGYKSNPLQLWVSDQSEAPRDVIGWARAGLPREAGIVTDMYAWLDLHAPPDGMPVFDVAHYYWKLGLDPEIRDGVFSGNWREVQYLIVTDQMVTDANSGQLPLVKDALDHAVPVRRFDTGGWPVIVERVNHPQSWAASDDRLLQWLWGRQKDDLGLGLSPSVATEALPAGRGALALWQAAYMDDRAAFDEVWSWMRSRLAYSDGRLAEPPQPRGHPRVRVPAGPQVDTDLAVALAFASSRWNDAGYRAEAKRLIETIWNRETVAVKGGRLVVSRQPPGSRQARLPVDLSAVSPYAYRIFGKIDPVHQWSEVVEASYRFLANVQALKATGGRAGLLPRWAAIEPRSGRAFATAAPGKQENLFDAGASQAGWRVGLDWLWNRDVRAQGVLRGLFLPKHELERKGWLGRAYRLNGQPVDGSNTIATYTTALPSVLFGGKPELAASAFTNFVLAPVAAAEYPGGIRATDRAWAWFGTALMDGALVDLTRPADRIDWSAVPGVGP